MAYKPVCYRTRSCRFEPTNNQTRCSTPKSDPAHRDTSRIGLDEPRTQPVRTHPALHRPHRALQHPTISSSTLCWHPTCPRFRPKTSFHPHLLPLRSSHPHPLSTLLSRPVNAVQEVQRRTKLQNLHLRRRRLYPTFRISLEIGEQERAIEWLLGWDPPRAWKL